MSDFNTTLHRNLLDGTMYTHLISRSLGSVQDMGSGDTLHSTRAMKQVIIEHYKQSSSLVDILKADSLKETCNRIFHFLYNHIQYKQDGRLQQLRSPASSWDNREIGVDCKSYSIFAGALLYSLGYKFYIRQIKQPNFNPTSYTHVYIIVPYNQVTGTLQDGYYTIDATVKNNIEPIYTQKHDLYMANLQHVALNGATLKKTKKTTKKKPVARKKKPSGLLGVGLLAVAGLGIASILK